MEKHNIKPIFTITVTIFFTILFFPLICFALPGFPGAEGFGSDTIGGRGGQVIEVTNLNDSGTGSLRAAVEASGPRVIVFRTGGTIEINNALYIKNPYITIAGQTAPGGGITIRFAEGVSFYTALTVETHDVIIRYITIRRGPGGGGDTFGIQAEGYGIYNVVVDHCSFSWGVDETFSSGFGSHLWSAQWNIISESLDCSTHPKGCHAMGARIGSYSSDNNKTSPGSYDISFHHNLLANTGGRTPLIQCPGLVDMVNNVFYFPNGTFTQIDMEHQMAPMTVNIIGNYYKTGPSTEEKYGIKVYSDPSTFGLKVYTDDNILRYRNGTIRTGGPDVVDSASRGYLVSQRHDAPPITTTSPAVAYDKVLNDAGSNKGIDCYGNFYNRRDAHDTRVVKDVINVTGTRIDDPSEVGGWLDIETGVACSDNDHDGMPDTWENLYGFNPNSSSDNVHDFDGDGYTNIEEYLNGTNPKDGVLNNNPPEPPAGFKFAPL